MSKIAHFFYKNLPISINLIRESPNKRIYLSDNIFVHSQACEILRIFSEEYHDIAVHVAEYGLYGGIQHRLLSGEGESTTIHYEKNMVEGSLRLIKPLLLSYVGCIELRGGSLYGYSAEKHKSAIYWKQPDRSYQDDPKCTYNEEDLKIVRYLTSFFSNNQSFCDRLKKIVYYFMHKDIWENLYCRDTIFQGLFAVLDALSLNTPSRHSTVISSCLGKWLNHVHPEVVTKGIDFEQLILRLWDSYRHSSMHFSISTRPPSIHYKRVETGEYHYIHSNESVIKEHTDVIHAPMILHEIVRLILLSIIFLPEASRQDFINFPLIENHKRSENIEKRNRYNLITKFFNNLISKDIKPSKVFWVSNIHYEMFLNFLSPPVLQPIG